MDSAQPVEFRQSGSHSLSIFLPRSRVQAAVGDLENVVRIVKVMSLVNSAPTFTEQHLVTNEIGRAHV